MIQSEFSNTRVAEVSSFLQKYMKTNCISQLTADECADLPVKEGILPNDIGPNSGFNFRQMQRDGRDELVDLVEGAYQKRPNMRWIIYRSK